MEAFVLKLQKHLDSNLRKSLANLKGQDYTIKEVTNTLSGLADELQSRGLEEQVAKLHDLFKAEYEAAAEDFTVTTGKDPALSGFAKENLEAFVDERLNLSSNYIQQYIGDVRTTLVDSVILGQPASIITAIDGVSDKVMSNLLTELDTSVSAYQRIVHLDKAAKANINKFLYIGPLDRITRPFCKPLVDKIFTLEEIQAMDNGTDLPVEIYCGGYNCRHHWRPVSDSYVNRYQEGDSEGGD